MKSLSKNMFKVSNGFIKLGSLCIFMCDDVYASQVSVAPANKFFSILFDKEMLFLIILLLFIVGLIIKNLFDKKMKKKKEELDKFDIRKETKDDVIKREEFKKLQEKYDELRNQDNLKQEARKDNIEDYEKTMLLSRVELDISMADLARIAESKNKAEEVLVENEEEVVGESSSSVEVDTSKTEVAEVDEDKISLKDINEELRQEREDLDSETSKEEVKEAENFYGVRKIGKNVKNVVDKAIELRRKQLSDYAYCLNENIYGAEKFKTVINTFIEGYIDFKYKRQHEHQYKNVKAYKKLVNDELENIRVSLIKVVNRSYSDEYVNKVYNMFLLINVIDSLESINLEKVINDCDTLEFIDKESLIKKMNKIYKLYFNIFTDYYNKLTVDKFELVNNYKIDTGNLFEPGKFVVTNIVSTLQFSKIFSNYIIDKTYNSSVIFEDIREVQLKLVSLNILNDMLRYNNSKKYVISFPASIFKKERKIKTVLGAVNDAYSQNKLFILIDLESLKFSYHEIINLRREGYKFIVQVSADNIKLYDKLKESLSIADYLVYVGPRISKSIMKDYVPSYLLKKIIYVDKSLIEGVVVK